MFGLWIKQKNNCLGMSSLHFFNWCSQFFSEKRIHKTFQNLGDKTQRQRNSLKTLKSVDYYMKWIVLPYSESYFEETKCILVKFYQFSRIQEYYKRMKRLQIFSLFYMPTFLPNLRLMLQLSFVLLSRTSIVSYKLIVVMYSSSSRFSYL